MELVNYQNIPLVLFSLAVIYFSERIVKYIKNENKREESDIKTQDFVLDLALNLQKKVDDLEKLLRNEMVNVRTLESNILVLMNEKERIEALLKQSENNALKIKSEKEQTDLENKRLKSVLKELNTRIVELEAEIERIKKKEEK